MSRRIAHRPRYRSARQLIQQPSQSSYKAFFRKRWSYRRQEATYEQHPLGYALSFIPVPYHLMPTIFLSRF
jgi:hypothetical protein